MTVSVDKNPVQLSKDGHEKVWRLDQLNSEELDQELLTPLIG